MSEAISLFSQEGSDFIEARNLLLEDKIEAAYVNLKKRIRELEAELEVYREKERLEWERSRDERF